jgi:hypothetical protein
VNTSTTSSTATTSHNLDTRTARLAKEFIRLNTKFSKQNMADRALTNAEVAENARKAVVQNEHRDFPNLPSIKTEDVAKAVREMMAYEREQRRAANIEAAKRAEEVRKARLVKCPACGIKRRDPSYKICGACAHEGRIEDEWQAKTKPRSPTPEEVDLAWARLQREAAEAVFESYCLGELPNDHMVILETSEKLRIQGPNILWILYLTEETQAEVHDLSIDQIDEGWDDETVAA